MIYLLVQREVKETDTALADIRYSVEENIDEYQVMSSLCIC